MSTSAFANQLQFTTQHLDIRGNKESGLQQDVAGRAVVTRKLELGLLGTYLERYHFFEKRFGAMAIYRPSDTLTLEARTLFADHTQILPQHQHSITAYYALADGLTPFVTYKDSRYSVTRLHQYNFAMEIEKFRSVVLMPQFMFGKATLTGPSETRDVHNIGLRAIYYHEKRYSLFIFGHKGTEASQGVVGKSNLILDTLTGGLGGSYYFIPPLKTEIILDHTDYKQIKTQFLTTTLNIVWDFL